MILKYADNADIFDYKRYGRCAIRAFVPAVPGIAEINLFVNFGSSKPSSFEIWMVNACKVEASLVSTGCYTVAYSGSYWYGVFKALTTTSNYSQFLFAIKTSNATYFSDVVEIPECGDLTKLSVCYPNNYNAEDINGVYIGWPDPEFEVVGSSDVIYQHKAWVRMGEIIETSNKIKYVSSRFKNFSTYLVRQWELRSEIVPGWYKDILLAIYFRGNILINGQEASIEDLNFEDVDVDYWKAYAILSKEFKGSFGCASIECAPECVCYEIGLSSAFSPAYNTYALVPFSISKELTGTSPYLLTDIVKPDFVEVSLTGSTLTVAVSATISDVSDDYYPVSFKLKNACSEILIEFGVKVTDDIIVIPPNGGVDVRFDLYGRNGSELTAQFKKVATGAIAFEGGILNDMPATAYIATDVLESYTQYQIKVHGDPMIPVTWLSVGATTKKIVLSPGDGYSAWVNFSTGSVSDLVVLKY